MEAAGKTGGLFFILMLLEGSSPSRNALGKEERMVRIKRVYDKPGRSDGVRILVDRIWPRGVAKTEARIDEWRKDLAPTKVLRQWFDHDPSRWDEFRLRFRNELEAAGQMEELRILGDRARWESITLVYAARDEEHNNAVVIKKLVDMLSSHLTAPQ